MVIKGSYAAVARVAGEGKVETPQGTVPTFDLDWLPGQDSNLRPAGNSRLLYQLSYRGTRGQPEEGAL